MLIARSIGLLRRLWLPAPQKSLHPIWRQPWLRPAGQQFGGYQRSEHWTERDPAVGNYHVESGQLRVRADEGIAVQRHRANSEPGSLHARHRQRR